MGDHEATSLAKLSAISPPTSSGPVIAVDLDDVLCQTNQALSKYYYYWKNPHWGTPTECFRKVNEFYACDAIFKANPVPGAREGVQALRDLGYRLVIVTARMKAIRDSSWDWIQEHFPDLFDSIICTGQFEDSAALKEGHEMITKLTKHDVCVSLGAKLLIDDSLENTLECVSQNPPTHTLLFGDYEWNKRQSFSTDNRDDTAFAYRLEAEGPEFWKADEKLVVFPPGAPLWRVRDWADAIRWIKQAREEGRL
ncbi:hypothetical protein HWV62_44405 [Athelia sp. TMB]|nr:hypothetical protein HWV62_8557 [Athelia sp. TMB]KAF7978896.1 hypothetical protein HWV62_44405 [Athelia sp. TMB]